MDILQFNLKPMQMPQTQPMFKGFKKKKKILSENEVAILNEVVQQQSRPYKLLQDKQLKWEGYQKGEYQQPVQVKAQELLQGEKSQDKQAKQIIIQQKEAVDKHKVNGKKEGNYQQSKSKSNKSQKSIQLSTTGAGYDPAQIVKYIVFECLKKNMKRIMSRNFFNAIPQVVIKECLVKDQIVRFLEVSVREDQDAYFKSLFPLDQELRKQIQESKGYKFKLPTINPLRQIVPYRDEVLSIVICGILLSQGKLKCSVNNQGSLLIPNVDDFTLVYCHLWKFGCFEVEKVDWE